MNLLFRIVYAAHANGTHHKLALDALRYLDCAEAPAWRAAFLKHVEAYLEGSKAPDKEFKDFKNHVLHVRDDYWGGAPEKAESWYALLVRALKEEDMEQAAWCAGVLSHYYTDPIHPFHTAQSEAESNIHRAVEWSIAKSYADLRARGLQHGLPDVAAGSGDGWLKDMVIAGAELSNRDYETIIAHYNFDIGVVDPPAGLDETAREAIGRLVVYASCGFARILDRAIDEAATPPPDVALGIDTLLATLKIPVKWVTRKMADAREARAVEAMFDELRETGRVDKTLSEDDRTVRDLYAREVLSVRRETRENARRDRMAASPLPQGTIATIGSRNLPPLARTEAKVAGAAASTGAASTSSLAATVPAAPTAPRAPGPAITSVPSAGRSQAPSSAPATSGLKRPRLQLSDGIEAAPSIGPKTAARLEAIGIISVADFMAADPEEMADDLRVRHMSAANLSAWQAQTRLMLEIPGLRVSQAQLFVGAGFATVEEIALSEPAEVSAAMLRFAATPDGQRVLGSGAPPDLEAITAWIDAAGEAQAA